MADNPMRGPGGVAAWLIIFCLLGALFAGPALRGLGGGINGFGNAMRAMVGEEPRDG